MPWLNQRSRPEPPPKWLQSTTIFFDIYDCEQPVIHNLPGLWADDALHRVLETLVQEYYHPDTFNPKVEVFWQDGETVWEQEIDVVIDVYRPGGSAGDGGLLGGR